MAAPVVNQLAYVGDWLALNGLDSLLNKLSIAKKFYQGFTKEFERPFPVGHTVRVPFPWRPVVRRGIEYQGQPITTRETSITVQEPFGIDWEHGAVETALELERSEAEFKKKRLDPAMKKIAQEIESVCAEYGYLNTSNVVGTLGTAPATFDAYYGAANQRMTELGIDPDGRTMTLDPAVARVLRATTVSQFNPVKSIDAMLTRGIIGERDGMDTYESMSLYRHTAGTHDSTGVVFGAGQDGASIVCTITAAQTFTKGDVITFAGSYAVNPGTGRQAGTGLRQFRITADYTAAGGAGADTLPIAPAIKGPGDPYQNVTALPTDGGAITSWPGTTLPASKAGTQSLALSPMAFALVGIAMENPKQGTVEIVSAKRDPETGIQVNFVKAFDPHYRRMIHRFDVLLGLGVLYADDGASVRCVGA